MAKPNLPTKKKCCSFIFRNSCSTVLKWISKRAWNCLTEAPLNDNWLWRLFQRHYMTTIKNKGVNIVTLEPYCGMEPRIQPTSQLMKKKNSNTLIAVIERKILTQTKNRWKVSKFNFPCGPRGKNSQNIDLWVFVNYHLRLELPGHWEDICSLGAWSLTLSW